MTSSSLFEDAPAVVREVLPKSCKLVWLGLRELDDGSGVTQRELAAWTSQSQRTVRYALRRLEEHGVVDSRTDVRDARRDVYWLTGE